MSSLDAQRRPPELKGLARSLVRYLVGGGIVGCAIAVVLGGFLAVVAVLPGAAPSVLALSLLQRGGRRPSRWVAFATTGLLSAIASGVAMLLLVNGDPNPNSVDTRPIVVLVAVMAGIAGVVGGWLAVPAESRRST